MALPQWPHITKSKWHKERNKKTKLFCSFNRYDAIAKGDSETETKIFLSKNNVVGCEQLPQTEVTSKYTRTASIYVKIVTNFLEFNKKLISLTGTKNFSCKYALSFLIVRPVKRINFNIVNDYSIGLMQNFPIFGRIANANIR